MLPVSLAVFTSLAKGKCGDRIKILIFLYMKTITNITISKNEVNGLYTNHKNSNSKLFTDKAGGEQLEEETIITSENLYLWNKCA